MRSDRARKPFAPRLFILESRTLLSGSPTPNATAFNQQWGLSNPANNGVDIDALNAWGITTGSSSVVVAVVGTTGVAVGNPDLIPNEWTNPSGDPQGYPSGINGWNFSASPPSSNINDTTNGHDTNVAGIIASNPASPSGPGVTGAAYNTKFLYAEGSTQSQLAQATTFAVDHGAKVINMSFDGSESSSSFPSDPLYQAIQYADSKGVVVVVAAGNGGTTGNPGNPGQDDGSTTLWPASYNLPNMIVVTGINSDGTLNSGSNYGSTTVAVGAPGYVIYTTGLQSQSWYYPAAGGTSFAAPFVTGVAALIEAQAQAKGLNLSAEDVVNRIVQNTKPLASLAGKTTSGGMVDAYFALEADAHTNAGGFSLAAGSTVGNGSFTPDTEFTTGGSADSTTHAIDTTGISNPPNQAVLQAERYDASGAGFTETIPGLTPNTTYNVRLDFSENSNMAVSQRVFDVAINNVKVLSHYDILQAAGSPYKLVAPSFTATTDQWGKISITFTSDTGNAKVDAIEVTPVSSSQVTPVNLSGAYNVVGITNDSNTSPGNLDGSGQSYSGNLLGSSLTINGATYNFGPAGSNDAVQASSQVVTLPAGHYGGLDLLGTGVNGSQSGTFTILYTDGTTALVPLTFDDWHNGLAASGETVAEEMAYRNASSGRDAYYSDFYLDSSTITLDPTKTVQSVTLPGNSRLDILAADLIPSQGTAVNLSGSYNVVGITTDGASSSGNLDGQGDSFSSNLMGTSLGLGGNSYSFGPAGANDAVQATGQTINLPAGNYGDLSLLVAAVNGSQTGTFTITYTDNSTTSVTLTLDDWHDGASAAGESVAKLMAYRNTKNGKDAYFSNFYLYQYDIVLDSTKTVRSIMLPSGGSIDLFAADLVPPRVVQVDLTGQDNVDGITPDSSAGSGNLDGSGSSYSSTQLGADLTSNGASFFTGPVSPNAINNALAAKGQTITLAAGQFSSLRLIGTGVNGTQTGTFTVYYSDGSDDTITQSFDDWYGAANSKGETLARAMSHRNTTGGPDNRTFNVYSYSLAINPTKTVSRLVLPSDSNIAILALDLLS